DLSRPFSVLTEARSGCIYNFEMADQSSQRARSAAFRVLNECIGLRARVLNRIVTAVYDEALRPHGVTCAQFNLLVAVEYAGEHATPSNISRKLRLEKSTLTRDVGRMVERGWVARTARTDQRSHTLELTRTGRALFLETLPAWEKAQARVAR